MGVASEMGNRLRATALWSHAEEAMSINKTRSILYRIARILGDVNAVQKGKVGRRIARRVVGKAAGRGMRKLFR